MTVAPVAAVIEADEAFYNTWARTDKPVADGLVERTWMWGPGSNSEVIAEPYAEHPTGERPVQYWDKSRMEVNDPNAPYDRRGFLTGAGKLAGAGAQYGPMSSAACIPMLFYEGASRCINIAFAIG